MTAAFVTLCSSGENADAVIADCLAQVRAASIDANLGFVYFTEELVAHAGQLVHALRELTAVQCWLGSSGIGICAGAQEIYDGPAVAIMLARLPADAWRELPAGDFAGSLAGAGEWARRHPGSLGLLHADGAAAMGDNGLEALVAAAPDIFFTGGLSSGDNACQVSGEPVRGAIGGAVFAPSVAVAVDHSQGCTPIGPRHRITGAQRNIAITLDGRPALEVLREDVGEVMARDLRRAGNYIFAALSVPGSDTGDYLVRNLIGIDEEQGLVAIGDYLEPQRELMFCRRDGNSASEDLVRMAKALKTRIGAQPIRGAVYVSCLARGRHQFGEHSEEVRCLRAQLGDFPMVGFFANGEIYNGRVYGYTGVLNLFL